MSRTSLSSLLSPPLDSVLVDLLEREYISMVRRYYLRDWEPTTLDGGQFAEIIARIVYHVDSNNLNRTKAVDRCLGYVENDSAGIAHAFPERQAALMLCRVIRLTYKFRSSRGAIHITPTYTANQLDSKVLFENCKWMVCELLRLFGGGNDDEIEAFVRELVEYEVPAIGEYDGQKIVQRVDCSTEEEILILLYAAGLEGLSRKSLGNFVMKSQPAITNTLKSLSSQQRRMVIQLSNSNYLLTGIGKKYVLNNLFEKFNIQ